MWHTGEEVAQKEAVDAKNQLKKLETALEHEKQLKTEVNLRNVLHVHTHIHPHNLNYLMPL